MAKEELIEDLSKGRITFRHIENRSPRAGAHAFKRKR